MRIVAFHQSAFEQYNEQATTEKKMFERTGRLIADRQNAVYRNRKA